MWVFILYKIGQLLSCYLPSSLAYWIARRIADLFFFFSVGKYKIYKRAVLHNVSLVVNLKGHNKEECGRRIFYNFAGYLREFLWLARISRSRFFKQMTPVGIENLDAALESGKGVLLLSAHFGNWEWGGIGLALCGYPIHFLVRPHVNSYTRRLFSNLREKHNVKVISINYLKKVRKLLKENAVVATLVDEAEEGIEVNMFGKEVTVASGPFTLAYRSGAVISPAFMVRDRETGRQRGVVEPPIFLNYNLEIKRSCQLAAQEFVHIMEDYLRFYPDHWLLLKKKNYKQSFP